MGATYIAGLNPAQLQAVEHSPTIPLQILAGPGSGKTRVLTTRIAHLILYHGLQPSSLCAVTFTNKAAGEMRTRLEKLIGKGKTDQIHMGTFHSLCARFLRRHADKVGIRGNFTICDADESKKLIKKSLKQYAADFDAVGEGLPDPGSVANKISQAKAKGLSPRDLLKEIPAKSLRLKDVTARVVAEIYGEYQRILRKSNSLDFDDLLVFGVRLFREHTDVGAWCKHILVDEFQDTNTIQYELMKSISAASKCVTIVGDPDQSIYGWRSAEIENIRRMTQDYTSVAQVLLEQNYRSTGAILAASVAIVAEDKKRMPKTLYTSHPSGSRPCLYGHENERDEGLFIALEIKRLIAYTGGMLDHNDFAILLRYNSLSRVLERELQKEGVPIRMLGGRKFFDRIEIKDLLAYLQLVDNPQYVPAFVRVINVPARAIGPKTVEQILARATELRISPMEVVQRIHEGKMPDTKPPVKRKVGDFVDAIRLLRERAEQHCSPSILIPKLVQIIEYEEHLKKTHKDYEERILNVEELMNFAAETETLGSGDIMDPDAPAPTDDPMEDTPLRSFLQASMLSTDTDTAEDDKSPKVTVATCHAAKGLEWPVVFLPAVEQGVFPASRAEDPEEERRLLYVACTRAQCYLTLTFCEKRFMAGVEQEKSISPFISCLGQRQRTLFADTIPDITVDERELAAKVIGRTLPGEAEITQKIQAFKDSRRKKPNSSAQSAAQQQDRGQSPGELPRYEGPAVFTSAAAALRAPLPTSTSSNRPPLQSSSNQVINGAARAHDKKPILSSSGTRAEIKSAHQEVIDLRSPSPEVAQPPKLRNAGKVDLKGKTPVVRRIAGSSSRAGSSPDASIDLRSPSPDLEPLLRPQGGKNLQIKPRSGPSSAKASSSSITSFFSPSSGAKPVVRPTVPIPAPSRRIVAPIVAKPSPAPSAISSTASDEAATDTVKPGTKKRLGMGRTHIGYSNKKFKAPS
ncbi:hypothetical protein EIP91_002947 [Steccherinum ochraceum]|uniref:DNA 3'-5' helicase n=1 Tax=Steccherinum ochraceum TaxID=92696 RepID=A0A4R0RJQ9_9APHY|nr:hypothetical protein EIP91_002947 [Steccherinum ochraceum]